MNKPIIILVHTQMAANIGMCARAMLNCGLTELRLVAPRDGWPNSEALASATAAKEIVQSATLYSSIEASTADCHQIYATTARSRHFNTPIITPTKAATTIHEHAQCSNGKTAVLFGPEASGLDNELVSHADQIIQFPMNPEYTSLNLAQAVLLFSWEWWKSKQQTLPDNNHHWSPAPKEEFHYFIKRLEALLDASGFFANPDKKTNTLQKIRAFFSRSSPSSQELKSLQGILTSLQQHKK